MEASLSYEKNCAVTSTLEQKYLHHISVIAHEFKNQLTLIDSSLQIVAKACPDVTDLSVWKQLHMDIRDSFRYLKDASSLAKMTAIRPDSLDIAGFLRETAASFAGLLKEKSILFQTNFHAGLASVSLYADAEKLREVLTNLILNAADALDGFREDGLILFTAVAEQSCVSIHVADNGPGIPGEYLDTLFDPFVTHKSSGTGLGLFIAKTIAEQHGGTIQAGASDIAGEIYTDFCIRLPIRL